MPAVGESCLGRHNTTTDYIFFQCSSIVDISQTLKNIEIKWIRFVFSINSSVNIRKFNKKFSKFSKKKNLKRNLKREKIAIRQLCVLKSVCGLTKRYIFIHIAVAQVILFDENLLNYS